MACRSQLLANEKNLTRQRDALGAKRRNLPIVGGVKGSVFRHPGARYIIDIFFEDQPHSSSTT